VALDVSGDGHLQLPPYPDNAPTEIYNITMFMYSYITGLNFTITNGTATAGNVSLGDIMEQEPSSTVKHVNWVWPDCLVGNGKPENGSSARGLYNISIHQNFRLNNTNYYTIFDLPIEVTNSIPAQSDRPSCSVLENDLLQWSEMNATATTIPPSLYPWANGNTEQTSVPTPTQGIGGGGGGAGGGASGTSSGNGGESTGTSSPLGPAKPDATPGDGIGGATTLGGPDVGVWWAWLAGLALVVLWL